MQSLRIRLLHDCSKGKNMLSELSISLIVIYSSHLPLLYVGMEQLSLSNLDYAGEALSAAYKMCDSDPLLLNELAVMAYHRKEYVLT